MTLGGGDDASGWSSPLAYRTAGAARVEVNEELELVLLLRRLLTLQCRHRWSKMPCRPCRSYPWLWSGSSRLPEME